MQSLQQVEKRRAMLIGLVFVGLAVLLTVYGQMIFKWQVSTAGSIPDDVGGKFLFVARQYTNPWIISAVLSAFLASACWIFALTRLDLSFAYPFMSLSFIFVVFLSIVLFDEPFTWNKVLGVAVAIIGLFISTR